MHAIERATLNIRADHIRQKEAAGVEADRERRQAPQGDAIELLSGVLQELLLPERDLQSVLRRCYHACQLLDWGDSRDWFYRELNGYPNLDSVPMYRHVPGRISWRPSAGLLVAHDWAVEDLFSTEQKDHGEPTTLVVFAELHWLLKAAQSGYVEITGETRGEYLRRRDAYITMEQIRVFTAADFARVVTRIESATYTFASDAYRLLKYGDVVSDVWQGYRRQVDRVLAQLGFTEHLEAIHTGLQSGNPQGWRNAVFGCRNVLTDAAAYLWQDKRKTYSHLNNAEGRAIKVTAEKFANRLGAYLHQKGLTGTSGKFMRDEVERLAGSIRSLVAYQSEAHAPIAEHAARSIAVATYVILGELATRTDMRPITKYGTPAVGTAEQVLRGRDSLPQC